MGTTSRHLRWSARARLSQHAIYLPLVRRRHGHAVVSADSELLIDGFTRSAGTFAVFAFQLAQPRPVRLAHHLHAVSHIAAAVRLGVPALVPVRDPESAVVSCVVREPYVTIPQALHHYVRFHRRLLDYRDRVVVSGFEQVTGDLGTAIERVNDRFGTGFAPFHTSDERLAQCFALIDDRARRPPWEQEIGYYMSGLIDLETLREAERGHREAGRLGRPLPEQRVARPHGSRDDRRAELAEHYAAPAVNDLRQRAEQLHNHLVP